MKWCEKIGAKLGIIRNSKLLITDNTSILLADSFQDWLVQKNIDFEVIFTQSTLLTITQKSSPKLIITTLEDIPSYICNNYECQSFDFRDLPFYINETVARQLSTEDLIKTIDYLSVDNTSHINENNLEYELQQAQAFYTNQVIKEKETRINNLITSIMDYQKLLTVGQLWGELLYLYFEQNIPPNKVLEKAIDDVADELILNQGLRGIFYASTTDIRVVSKIPQFLTEQTHEKIALLCMDCMGVAEWQILKSYLKSTTISFQERFTFAIIPSMTSISRTALYYGKYSEVFSLKSINEKKYFGEYFQSRFHQHFKNGETITSDRLLGVDVVSKTFNFFDDLCHSTVFPSNVQDKSPYFKTLQNYIESSSVIEEIQVLMAKSFKIFLCSDHGSVVAVGNGKRVERWLQDKFAKRGVLVDNVSALETADFEGFKQYEIPFIKNKTVILPPGRTLFDTEGRQLISHGGISVEEIVVPFIELI